MNSPEVKARFQLSLRALLAFVIAVAVWLLIATRSASETRGSLVVGSLVMSVPISLFVYGVSRSSSLLLIFLFEVVVLGSHSALRYSERLQTSRFNQRMSILTTLEYALFMYSSDCHEYPPPSKELDRSGADLFTYLCVKHGQHGPYLYPESARTENGVTYLVGAFGNKILWAKNAKGERLVIDVGDDNLLGGTIDANGIFTQKTIDANHDGRNDGDDDLIVTVKDR